MGWTAITALVSPVLFGKLRDSDQSDPAWAAYELFWVLACSAQLAALAVLLSVRRKGNRDWQPGHALLVLTLFQFACWFALELLQSAGLWNYSYYLTYRFLRGLGVMILALLLRRSLHLSSWRWVMVAIAFAPVMHPILRWMVQAFVMRRYDYHTAVLSHWGCYLFVELAVIALIVRGVSADHKRGLKRHWTHTLGVAPILLGWVATALMLVLLMLRPEPS